MSGCTGRPREPDIGCSLTTCQKCDALITYAYHSKLNTVWFGLVWLGSVRFGSVRFGLVRFGSVRFGSVRFGSVRFGSVRFGSVRSGVTRHRAHLANIILVDLGSSSTRFKNVEAREASSVIPPNDLYTKIFPIQRWVRTTRATDALVNPFELSEKKHVES